MEWKPVKGYEGLYEVSECGLVKSLERFKVCGHKGSKPQLVNEKLIKISTDRIGYKRVKLSKDGVSKLCTVHRLVALAFIENELNKKEVNHIDGDKNNNHVTNLEWMTRSENMKHSFDIGINKVNKDKTVYRRNTKIDMNVADKIRDLRNEGLKIKEIAEKFEVSISTVSMICKNKIWKG